jgi:hypothetical protein
MVLQNLGAQFLCLFDLILCHIHQNGLQLKPLALLGKIVVQLTALCVC